MLDDILCDLPMTLAQAFARLIQAVDHILHVLHDDSLLLCSCGAPDHADIVLLHYTGKEGDLQVESDKKCKKKPNFADFISGNGANIAGVEEMRNEQ